MAVHCRDAQRGDIGDDVAADGAAQPHGPEDGRGRGVSQVQRRRHDLAVWPRPAATGGAMGGESSRVHWRPYSEFNWPGPWPRLLT
ncbi:hypothetical protein I547_1789 [Mycobacterium kansasii 824]|nr:hypothetical protein I547_1789 [Mycobacterium kansasii 824]